MKLFLDQMLRVEVAEALRSDGYDVIRASEVQKARADDKEILHFAISQNRTLVTLDDHFGDWTILPLSQHPGVIRLKVHPATTAEILEILLPFLKRQHDLPFANHLVIVSARRERWIATA